MSAARWSKRGMPIPMLSTKKRIARALVRVYEKHGLALEHPPNAKRERKTAQGCFTTKQEWLFT